jgi:hypothetical protein
LLEDRGQLGVTVGHIRGLLFLAASAGGIRQNADDLPQSEQRFIDVDALLGLTPLRARHPDPLRPRQIHQFQLATKHTIGPILVKTFNPNGQNRVTPRTLNVELMGGLNSIFDSGLKILPKILLILALKNIQIFYAKLFVFVPPQPEPRPSSFD